MSSSSPSKPSVADGRINPFASSPSTIIERADVMMIVAGDRPDFGTISALRKRHLAALASLFTPVLLIAAKAGLVRRGDELPARQPNALQGAPSSTSRRPKHRSRRATRLMASRSATSPIPIAASRKPRMATSRQRRSRPPATRPGAL